MRPEGWGLELVEAAYIDGRPGLLVHWWQDNDGQARRFGLLAELGDVSTLADSNEGHFYLSDLYLMFAEPHAGGSNNELRMWFTSTASFNYGR